MTNDHAKTINNDWFYLRYAPHAPAGLPPMIQADQVLRYTDDTDTWVIALWAATEPADNVANCILRVPAHHVRGVTRHDDMSQAARHYLLEQPSKSEPRPSAATSKRTAEFRQP